MLHINFQNYSSTLKNNFRFGEKTVTIKSVKTARKEIKKLKAKKIYYVQIRTYKKIGDQNYYSAWSKAKSTKTK